MKKICAISGKEFEITQEEKDFLNNIAPTFDGERFNIPLPNKSPEERARQRVSHRNEQFLFQNKNSFSGEPLLSIYRPDSEVKVCSREEWFSDVWDAIEFGRDFENTKSFFDQYHELQKEVPYASLVTVNNENCPYATSLGESKNCFLVNSSDYCEDCLYGKLLQHCTSTIDSSFGYKSELLYECFSVENCYDCKWVYYSQGCHDCWFCDDCRGCHHCFLCTNLVKKEYYFMNEKVSREEYEKRIADFLSDHKHILKAKSIFDELRKKRIYKYARAVNTENCTGDFMINAKNCFNCYDIMGAEDCRYVQLAVESKDMLDCSNIYDRSELSYNTLGTMNTFNCHFCLYIFFCADLWYCEQCFSCKNCFGCVGLRNKQYCILNKQYKKDEYEKEVARIIRTMQQTGAWGQFFPTSISPFPYNDTVAQDYFPLTQKEVLDKNWRWGEDLNKNTHPQTHDVPKKITDVTDAILKIILSCHACGKNYRIQPLELTLYRKMKLPIPQECPHCRYKKRMEMRNPRKLYDRNCDKCEIEIQTTFAPERSEKVYCEKCYLDALE